MAVLRESPWYQEILQEGEARGEARGIVSSIGTILQAKFGQQGLELMPQISQISDVEQLQSILRSITLANNFEEVRQVL
jgi:predicted transposase YdaD